MKYKHSLLRTMLNRAFKLSSTWQFFHQECERLKEIFTRLHYPEPLIQNTIRLFVEMKVTGSKRPPQQAGEIPVRIPLPFKDQRSANKLREQLSDLSRKIKTEVFITKCFTKNLLFRINNYLIAKIQDFSQYQDFTNPVGEKFATQWFSLSFIFLQFDWLP